MPEHKTVHEALAAVQEELKAPPKDAVNRAFGGEHWYTKLETLIKHIRPTLKKNGLMAYIKHHAGEIDTAKLVLFHPGSGHQIESELSLLLERKNNWAQGSACTYAARYLIEGMFMLGGTDDDGVAACIPPADKKANPLLDIPNPEKLMEKVVNEVAANDPMEKPEGWEDRLKMIDEVIETKGWADEPFIIAQYTPIKKSVELAIQGKEVFG